MDDALLLFLGEELYNMVSEYGDIIFDFQSDEQKFYGYGLTQIWVKQNIF